MMQHKFEDYELLIGKLAMKGYKRLLANDAGADYDDVFQQMSLTFCMASQKFDASKGYNFSTYLVCAIWKEFNKWAESQIGHAHLISSAEAKYSNDDEISSDSLYDRTASDMPTPEDEISNYVEKQAAIRGLSRHAKRVLLNVAHPSKKLQNEWSAYKAHHEFGRSIGESNVRVGDDMNFTFIYDTLKVPQRKRSEIKRELGNAFGVKLL